MQHGCVHAYRQQPSYFVWQYRVGHGCPPMCSRYTGRHSQRVFVHVPWGHGIKKKKGSEPRSGRFFRKNQCSPNMIVFIELNTYFDDWVTAIRTKRCVTKTLSDTRDGEPGWISCIVYVIFLYNCRRLMSIRFFKEHALVFIWIKMHFVKMLIFSSYKKHSHSMLYT